MYDLACLKMILSNGKKGENGLSVFRRSTTIFYGIPATVAIEIPSKNVALGSPFPGLFLNNDKSNIR